VKFPRLTKEIIKMANKKCPMAGISVCTPACMWFDDKEGECSIFLASKRIGEAADVLGALKRVTMDLSATMAAAHAADKAKPKGKD
jgi:hypothetical protein